MLGTKEFYDILDRFKLDFKHLRLDLEPKERWSHGDVFQDGHTNEFFGVYLKGFVLAKHMCG
jgi:hypothetical protein